MEPLFEILAWLIAFAIVAVASSRIGLFGTRLRLPLISGFLLTGAVAGPFGVGLLGEEAVLRLAFVNKTALAIIAFAAGNELFVEEIRDRIRGIAILTAGLVLATFLLGGAAMFVVTGFVPLAGGTPVAGRIAIAAIVGAILVARSPSSAIAIVNELRAKGPFTQTILGVTVIMDVVVIVLFAVCSEAADAVLSNVSFSLAFVLLLGGELLLSLLAGVLVAAAIGFVLARPWFGPWKSISLVALGYAVFEGADALRHFTGGAWDVEILLEPLLICMVAGLLVTNASRHRAEFSKRLSEIGPPLYVAFFTLTGASLALDVLARAWPVALVLFTVRLVAIVIGSSVAGVLAGEPPERRRVAWMAFVTQAGIGIGLASEVAAEYPPWGPDVATIIIAIIVINQLVGPPLFKWAVFSVREARVRAPGAGFDGVRDVLIFGSGGGQSLTLARQLQARGWQVKVAVLRPEESGGMQASDVEIVPIGAISVETLQELGTTHADAVVALMSDDHNVLLCELVYEHFGIDTVVARVHDRSRIAELTEIGVLAVDPSTAMISLLEHLVTSPAATSLLLGMDASQGVVEVEVRDPSLDGVPLRDVKLPVDTLILSVCREGHTLLSHGYTCLRLGDHVTLVGSPEDLEEATLLFEP